MHIKKFLFIFLFFVCSSVLATNEHPPKVFVDKGACPFECCTYQEWTVKANTDLFDQVDSKKIIGKAKAGQKVQGVTGEVHTKPLKVKIKVSKDIVSELKDGDEVYLLTYQGEGFYKVWKNGKVIPNADASWDEKSKQESTWWVKIKLKDGTTGWTKKNENFGNKDACG